MRAIDQQTARLRIQHHLLAWNLEVQANHQAMAPDFANETMLTAQIPQALAKIIAGAPDRRQQLIQNVEKLERHTAGECAPAERGPATSRRRSARPRAPLAPHRSRAGPRSCG